MNPTYGIAICLSLAWPACGQTNLSAPQFAAAQVKQSAPGRGGQDRISFNAGSLTATGVSLKRLIFEAYDMPYYGIFGGPAWLDSQNYDVEAKADGAVGRQRLQLMLRTLLSDRLKLALHRETRELRVYALTVAKGGFKLQPIAVNPVQVNPVQEGASGSAGPFVPGLEEFRCGLPEFASRLALRLNTPMAKDPSTPTMSTGLPIPVIDKTGLKGIYDIRVEIPLDPGGDPFIAWQRALNDQLGLKLEPQKAVLDVLVVDHAERIPTKN